MKPAAFYVLKPSTNYSAVFKDGDTASSRAASMGGAVSPLYTPAQVIAHLLAQTADETVSLTTLRRVVDIVEAMG